MDTVAVATVSTVLSVLLSKKVSKVSSGNVRTTNDIRPMPWKATIFSCQVTHWLALGDWLQALFIGNLWELSVQFDKQPARNHALFVFSFSAFGTFIEDYCFEGEFIVLFPAAETLGNSVVSCCFKTI